MASMNSSLGTEQFSLQVALSVHQRTLTTDSGPATAPMTMTPGLPLTVRCLTGVPLTRTQSDLELMRSEGILNALSWPRQASPSRWAASSLCLKLIEKHSGLGASAAGAVLGEVPAVLALESFGMPGLRFAPSRLVE